ncbi:unnamed protein product [Ascophyllum nodosum]
MISILGRGRYGRSSALRMSALVEQPVTADEAIALISKAKAIVEGDMGVKVPDMLSEEFRFLWQFNGAIDRAEYLTEGKGPYTTLRSALPDLFWNAYDFRVDKYEKNRVWATTRLTGTHNGPLLYDGKEYPGTGNRIEAAPECVSVVFDEKSGLCTKMTGGFCIDRGVGNTGPAGGIWGVMQAIGEPVPAWKYYPLIKVFVDVVGPTFRPKKSPGVSAKLPFRDPIAIALVKQVLSAARDDPESLNDLLAEDVQIYAPIVGPLKKKGFVQSVSVDFADFFAGLDVDDNWYDARVDPFEPSRVWVTTRTTAKVVGPIECFGLKLEPKRQSFVGGPQTFSVTFDKDGYASKITLGCPMDPETGDTDGLGNFLGVLAGLGIPLPDLVGRPVPESFRRFVDYITPEAIKPKKTKRSPEAKAATTSVPGARAVAAASSTPRTLPKTTPSKKPSVQVRRTQGESKAPSKSAKAPAGPVFPSSGSKKSTPLPTTPEKPSAKARAPSNSPPKPTPKIVTKVTPKTAAPPKVAPPKAGTSKVASKTPAKAGKTAAGKTNDLPGAKATDSDSNAPPPFGGIGSMFRLGGGGVKPGAAPAVTPKSTPAKKEAPARSPPAKEAPTRSPPRKKVAPSPPAPSSKAKAATPAASSGQGVAKAAGGVTFSPQLTQKLAETLGSPQRLDQLSKRTALYARGAISATDYWGTLKTLLGPTGAQNLTPDIIGALPAGNQKTALLKIYSTG